MDKIKISTQQNAASIKSWVFETSMSNSTVTESLGGKAGAQDFSLSGKPGNCFGRQGLEVIQVVLSLKCDVINQVRS